MSNAVGDHPLPLGEGFPLRQNERAVAAGGEMRELIRRHDWSSTPLGPMAKWPSALRIALNICLDTRFPVVIYAGPDHILLYNDDWRSIPGDKHPWALGRSAREVFAEIWDIIGPMFEQVVSRGVATWSDDQLLPLKRYGYIEECYFYYSFSPIRSEDGAIHGIFTAVTETTYRVLNERRTRLLRTLAEQTLAAKSDEDVCHAAAAVLATADKDIPFSLLYLSDGTDDSPKLVATSGIPAAVTKRLEHKAVQKLSLWPLRDALVDGQPHVVEQLPEILRDLRLGPWPEAPHAALVIPLVIAGQGSVGALVAGVSSRRALDDDYRAFFQTTADHTAKALANARAYEQERRRAEALAELDRAKTVFFSNVSHEFRTPLTLMLGPLEDTLAETDEPLTPRHQKRLELIHRNGLRLLRLVNTLLDFSRIEAGRAQAAYAPTDLGRLTADLASTFRSAIERASMQLIVDCPTIAQPVHVDRDMWEKIVLNLLSNAFKHTFAGSITVSQREVGGVLELRVEDTGVGIAAEHLPRLFERFHRVQDAKSRTHEGSGIGLALVQELVKLHGGSVRAESEPDRGSTFIVTIPFGTSHLPADRIGAHKAPGGSNLGARPYVEEALRWLPETSDTTAGVDDAVDEMAAAPASAPRVLLADDNADMRGYVRRLLGSRWRVEAVADGAEALAAARAHPPDLILSDVMMPHLDGIGLLRAVRSDPVLAHVPVILLSARAGEEAGIEGLDAGADDYLTKPFSAQELVARVAAQLRTKRIREEANHGLRRALERLSLAQVGTRLGMWEYDHVAQQGHLSPECAELFGFPSDMSPRDILDESFRRIHPDDVQSVQGRLAAAVDGDKAVTFEYRYHHPTLGERWLMSRARRVLSQMDDRTMVIGLTLDITDHKLNETALRASDERYRGIFQQTVGGIAETDGTGRFTTVNDRYCAIVGYSRDELLRLRMQEITHPDDLESNLKLLKKFVGDGKPFDIEKRYIRKDGSIVWVHNSVSGVRDADGHLQSLIAVSVDITERRLAEAALRDSEQRFRNMADSAPVMTWVTEHDGSCSYLSRTWYEFTGQTPETGLGFGWLDAVHPDDKAESGRIFLEANGKQEGFSLEYRLRRKDGAYRWAIDSALPRLEPGGKFLGYIGSVIDISDRKEAEGALARRADELARANAELEHFASIASHDLQEPLRMISNYCDVLSSRYAPLFDAKAADYFSRITGGAQRMRALIHALLAYSQVDKQPAELTELPARAAVDNAVEHLQVEIAARDAEIAISELPIVRADPARLTQLFQNLIANALKFMPKDRRPVIRISAEVGADEWRFRVTDNGIGIPASQQDRIFRIFQRLHAADAYPGSGIGLATCKKIVEQHGGKIWVESTPDVGSNFSFSIPRADVRP